MISRSSSGDVSCVIGTDLAVNTKKLLKHTRPRVIRPGISRCSAAQRLQFWRAQFLNRVGKSFCSVFSRPGFLLMTNNLVHVTAANSDYWCAAGLTFGRNQPKRVLNARMNEKAGRAIIARKYGRVGA